MKTQYNIFTVFLCVLMVFNTLTSAQEVESFSKEIRVKKTITGTDTIVEYDTIIKEDHFNEEEFKAFWDQMEKDIASSMEPFQDVERFEDEWRKSMMYLDSINEQMNFDFDMDMGIDPPAYMFYFNHGKDSIRQSWNFYDWKDFEHQMQKHFSRMANDINRLLDIPDDYVKNIHGQRSEKIKIEKTSEDRFMIRLLEPMELEFIKVYDVAGNTVFYKYYCTGEKIEEVPLDLSMEDAGIYFLKIKTEKDTYLKRLVVS